MKKYSWVIIGTCIMAAIMMLCVYVDSDNKKGNSDPAVHILVNGTEYINLWEDEKENVLYAFLPSYADLEKTSLVFDDKISVKIDNNHISSGTNCAAYEPGKIYSISIGSMPGKNLCFLQSENTASLYVNTSSGGMDFVNNEKNHAEEASFTLYTPDGDVDYNAEFQDKIRGHGNHTWLAYEKKSYNLYMKEPTNLLGLGEGSKWVLLGNTRDDTHLRNKLVMDFAQDIGSYKGFSSASKYVNLYANGRYYGLYLLCRSVDDNLESVLDAAGENGFAIEMLPVTRIESPNRTIQFNSVMAAEVLYPDLISREQKDKIKNWILSFNHFINADSNQNDAGSRLSKFIDMKSWAEKYLVDMVFNEYDASYASKFFWGSTDDLVLAAGPCWDYDLAMGYHSTYYSFADEKDWRGGGKGDGITWNYGLWSIPAFREYVVKMYQNQFRFRLQELVDSGIRKEADFIAGAIELERHRWPELYTSYPRYENAVNDLITYMQQRIGFLDSYWVDQNPYCIITLKDPYGLSLRCYVPQDTICRDLLTPAELASEGETTWLYEDTQEPFDYDTVIHENITLVSKAYITNMNAEEEIPTSVKITALSLIIFLGMLLMVCIIDHKHRRREKS